MAIIIDIFVTPQGAAARKNRDSENPGEKVTWNFDPPLNTYHVVFKEFQPPGGGPRQPPPPVPAQGPFTQTLITIGGQVTGTIDPNAQHGLYFYGIQDDSGNLLRWLNPVGTTLNFGGLDVPKGPP
ncbi:MAG TPA: hypothetical protein VGM86_04065 [Thermoanaerobaculia bacterium]